MHLMTDVINHSVTLLHFSREVSDLLDPNRGFNVVQVLKKQEDEPNQRIFPVEVRTQMYSVCLGRPLARQYILTRS